MDQAVSASASAAAPPRPGPADHRGETAAWAACGRSACRDLRRSYRPCWHRSSRAREVALSPAGLGEPVARHRRAVRRAARCRSAVGQAAGLPASSSCVSRIDQQHCQPTGLKHPGDVAIARVYAGCCRSHARKGNQIVRPRSAGRPLRLPGQPCYPPCTRSDRSSIASASVSSASPAARAFRAGHRAAVRAPAPPCRPVPPSDCAVSRAPPPGSPQLDLDRYLAPR